MRERTARGIWKHPEQGESSRLNQHDHWVGCGHKRDEGKSDQEREESTGKKETKGEGQDVEAREDRERELRQFMAKRQVCIWMRNWERDTQELKEFRWEAAG